MSEKYRPSNGTDGMCFDEGWCSRCKRDQAFRDTWDSPYGEEPGCQILADALAFNIDDEKFPKAWVYRDGEPVCTEFEALDSKYRCRETPDMFGAAREVPA